jgi:hypothetical protein
MKHATSLLAALMLSACQSMQSDDPSLLSFRAPAGSTLALNKTVEIPAGQTHVMIQAGQLTAESKRNLYDLSCRLNFREFGPRTIQPEVFKVRRTEEREGWESRPNFYFYATEIFLDSEKGTDVIKMECDTWAMPPSFNFSYADIQQTLGDYLTFVFKSPASQKQ